MEEQYVQLSELAYEQEQSLQAVSAELSQSRRQLETETASLVAQAKAELDGLGGELAQTKQQRDQLASELAELESQQAASRAAAALELDAVVTQLKQNENETEALTVKLEEQRSQCARADESLQAVTAEVGQAKQRAAETAAR
eukprot:2198571-Pyramimonas_sp.AAC.1